MRPICTQLPACTTPAQQAVQTLPQVVVAYTLFFFCFNCLPCSAAAFSALCDLAGGFSSPIVVGSGALCSSFAEAGRVAA